MDDLVFATPTAQVQTARTVLAELAVVGHTLLSRDRHIDVLRSALAMPFSSWQCEHG